MEEIIDIPSGTKIAYSNNMISVAGKLGEIKKKLFHPNVNVKVEGDKLFVSSNIENRNAKKLVQTFAAHIRNMIHGVEKAYVYTMKIVYTHFPITVKVQGDKVIIENFLGERSPRTAKKSPNVEIKIDKQDITITGIDIDLVSQTASNIERSSRIVRKDRRVFQDGIYIVEKGR